MISSTYLLSLDTFVALSGLLYIHLYSSEKTDSINTAMSHVLIKYVSK